MRPNCLWVVSIALFFSHIVYAQNPQLISAMINGCGTSDGSGEYLILYSGPTAFTASTSTINIRQGSDNPPATTITDTFDDDSGDHVTNYVASLNAQLPVSGCSDLTFIVGTPGTNIAAGSHILVVNAETSGAISTTVFDFDGWCGNGMDDVYVFLSRDTSWPTNGKFANQPGTTRYFRSTVNTTTTDFNYFNGWASDADGNYVAWNDGGGAAPVYSNYTNCNPTDTQSLPVSLIYFKGQHIKNSVQLNWATAHEENNSHFEIQRSANGSEWSAIGSVKGGIRSEQKLSYYFVDHSPLGGRSFYRLVQHDFNGNTETFNVINVWQPQYGSDIVISPNPTSHFLRVDIEESIQEIVLINSSGHNWSFSPIENSIDVSSLKDGIYSVIVKTETRIFKEKATILH